MLQRGETVGDAAMTPFERIERARKVVLWRSKEDCTWKWIGQMLKIPAGAAWSIFYYGKRLEAALGRLPETEKQLAEILMEKFDVNGKYRVGNYEIPKEMLRELSTSAGLKGFEVGGKFYVKPRSGAEVDRDLKGAYSVKDGVGSPEFER